MKHITLVFALLASLIASPALAQQFPSLPPNTVVGRLGTTAGPAQAIPFLALSQNFFGPIPADSLLGNFSAVSAVPAPIALPSCSGAGSALIYNTTTHAIGCNTIPGAVASVANSDGTLTISPTIGNVGASLNLAHANTWTATQQFNSDVFFKSGRPWIDVRAFGAVGDGVTNDTTAVQNAINAIAALGAGTVYLPPGTYCVNGGVSVTTGVIHIEAASYAQLNTCGGNVTALTLNSQFSSITRTTIVGPGMQAGAAPAGNALTIGSSCVSCTVTQNLINGGLANILIQAADVYIENNVTGNAYGLGHVVMRLSGYLVRNKFDQNWPVSIPGAGLSPAARANTTGYANGTVVSLAGFYIQQGSGGACTSGGSPPTLQSYNVAITDGTCSWRLVAPTTHYGINYDTGTTQTFAWGNDTSGPFTAGIGITNSLAGANPQSVNIDGHTAGQTILSGIIANNGNGLNVTNSTLVNCLGTNCSGISIQSGWLGDATISGNLFFGQPFGVNVSAGTQLSIAANKMFGHTTAAVNIGANITDFSVNYNLMGTSAIWGSNTLGVNVVAGTSNRYNITFNPGATVTDNGSGVTKCVAANNFAPVGFSCGGTGLSSGTSGGVPYFNSTTTLASSALLTANAPIVGGGAGAAPVSGTRSGNTTNFTTFTGSLTSLHCATFDASGNIVDGGICLTTGGATLSASAGNPTGTTSLTGVMMGVGSTCTITPAKSTRIRVTVFGQIANSTNNDGAVAQLRFGTGTAPTNGAAPTGTSTGIQQSVTNNASTGGLTFPFSMEAIITGLTLSTAVWLDIDLIALTGGTATITNVGCVASEI